jgi:branched-chain amino acid transport system permease protein
MPAAMNFWLLQIFNGISFGMLLFLLASGLTLIFGLLRIVNMAHGVFYLWGGYIAYSMVRATGSYVLATVTAIFGALAIGLVAERYLIRKVSGDAIRQIILTFGLMMILAELTIVIWGGASVVIPRPPWLSFGVRLGSISVPAYRVAITLAGLLVALLLWLALDKTRLGAMVRASVDNREVAEATGIPVDFVFTGVFGLGAALAGLAGAIGGVFVGLYPGADLEILLLAFVVVIVGGIGSVAGAFVGSLFVGLVDSLGKVFFPEFAMFTLFIPIVLVLVFRPTGFFGRELS